MGTSTTDRPLIPGAYALTPSASQAGLGTGRCALLWVGALTPYYQTKPRPPARPPPPHVQANTPGRLGGGSESGRRNTHALPSKHACLLRLHYRVTKHGEAAKRSGQRAKAKARRREGAAQCPPLCRTVALSRTIHTFLPSLFIHHRQCPNTGGRVKEVKGGRWKGGGPCTVHCGVHCGLCTVHCAL